MCKQKVRYKFKSFDFENDWNTQTGKNKNKNEEDIKKETESHGIEAEIEDWNYEELEITRQKPKINKWTKMETFTQNIDREEKWAAETNCREPRKTDLKCRRKNWWNLAWKKWSS